MWDLRRAIAEDRQPASNVYNARQALEMIYGIYASHLARRVISFALADRAHPLGDWRRGAGRRKKGHRC